MGTQETVTTGVSKGFFNSPLPYVIGAALILFLYKDKIANFLTGGATGAAKGISDAFSNLGNYLGGLFGGGMSPGMTGGMMSLIVDKTMGNMDFVSTTPDTNVGNLIARIPLPMMNLSLDKPDFSVGTTDFVDVARRIKLDSGLNRTQIGMLPNGMLEIVNFNSIMGKVIEPSTGQVFQQMGSGIGLGDFTIKSNKPLSDVIRQNPKLTASQAANLIAGRNPTNEYVQFDFGTNTGMMGMFSMKGQSILDAYNRYKGLA